MALIHSHYENLKVARDAPPEVIRAAYRVLVRRYHPDLNPSAEAARVMAILNRAIDVLGHPQSRAEHDRWIAESEQAARQRQRLQESVSRPTYAVALRPARPVSVQNSRVRPRQPHPSSRGQRLRPMAIVQSERFAKVMVAMLTAVAVSGIYVMGVG